MSSRTFLFCFCLFAVSHVEAANILGVFLMTSPSHNIIHMAIIKALADAGHNTTVVTLLPLKDKDPKYHHIYIPPTPEDDKLLKEVANTLSSGKTNLFNNFKMLDLFNDVQQKSLKDPAFQELLNNKDNHFDLVILGFVFNDFLLGIADHFKCPVIISWINIPIGRVNDITGNPHGISYIPLPWIGNEPMGFWDRVKNFIISWLASTVLAARSRPFERYYNSNFPAERGYRSLAEMSKNVSLVFCSNFFIEKPVRPYTPNFIEIGGIQAKEKPDPLPKDIEDFIQTADDDVIFFSLGTNVKSDSFNANATEVIFNVLAGRKEKVLWKWDYPDGPGKASNIMYKQWLPQNAILAHPKVKLFITHGGKGSITESQFYGVPMLALPIFGDQSPNANAMQHQGYGLTVDISTITEKEFRKQLEEVLYNSTYRENVKQYSDLYRDRPMTAQQSVVYWSEYVMRHHGAKHMQSPRIHLNFWQYNCFDVVGFLIIAVAAVLFILKWGICWATRLLWKLSRGCLIKKKDE